MRPILAMACCWQRRPTTACSGTQVLRSARNVEYSALGPLTPLVRRIWGLFASSSPFFPRPSTAAPTIIVIRGLLHALQS